MKKLCLLIMIVNSVFYSCLAMESKKVEQFCHEIGITTKDFAIVQHEIPLIVDYLVGSCFGLDMSALKYDIRATLAKLIEKSTECEHNGLAEMYSCCAEWRAEVEKIFAEAFRQSVDTVEIPAFQIQGCEIASCQTVSLKKRIKAIACYVSKEKTALLHK